MKYLKLIVIFLFVFIHAYAQSSQDLYNKALEQYLDGNYEESFKLLEQIDSTNLYISQLKDQVLEKLGRSQPDAENKPKSISNNVQDTLVSQSLSDQSNNDELLYTQAMELFQNGSYKESLEILNDIKSDEIDTEPLRQQLNEKLRKTEQKISIQKDKDKKSDDELYGNAVELFNQGNYDEALLLLDQITSKEIDTEPLRKQILKEKIAAEKKNIPKPEPQSEPKTKPKPKPKPSEEKTVIETVKVIVPDTIIVDTSDIEQLARDTSKIIPIKKRTSDSNMLVIIVILILFLVFIGLLISIIVLRKGKKGKNTILGTPKLVIKNVNTGKLYSFKKNKILIGRNNSNDIMLQGNGISKQHAGIYYDRKNDLFIIKDMQSRNGTLLNGKKIKSARISDGDRIKLFKYTLIVKIN